MLLLRIRDVPMLRLARRHSSFEALRPCHELAQHNASSSSNTTSILVNTAYGWPINGATDSLQRVKQHSIQSPLSMLVDNSTFCTIMSHTARVDTQPKTHFHQVRTSPP